MQTRINLPLAGFMAALLLSTAVASSSAGRLSVSNRNIRVVWNPLKFVADNAANIECPVTIEGSFHSATLRKVVGALIGFISRATAYKAACKGSFEFLPEFLPWHVRYRGFVGSLPTVIGVELGIIGMGWFISIGGIECGIETTAEEPFVVTANTDSTGRVTGLRAGETHPILLQEAFFCGLATSGRFAGVGTVTLLGTTTAITIKLI